MSTRDEVLRLLELERGNYISGAELARRLGISGTAVWKAVRRLQTDGYRIDAVTNRGYRLAEDADILSADAVLKYYGEGPVPLDVEVFSSVGSTNTICRERAESVNAAAYPVYVAIAANQTVGRGRRGRSFYSPDCTGLYMSILLRPRNYSAEQAMRFTTTAAAAVAEAIEEVSGRTADIKWVNDVFIEGRKVCGILTEASFDLESSTLDYAVIGIGINVFTPEGGFPDEIRDVAGAVFDTDCPVSDARSRLAASVLRHFFSYYSGKGRSYIDAYRNRCFVIGKDINVIAPGADPQPAVALDIDDECGLIVRYEDGREDILRSGEISIRTV